MSKLIIMKGLPACGKSTRAEEIMKADGNVVRVNKDLMRTMLHFDKFNGRNEGMTREAVRTLAKTFLAKTNVIVDDTNLNEGTMQGWLDLAKEVGAKVEIVDMTDVPTEVCVARDLNRAKSVGGTVIKNMALRAGIKTFPAGSVVLCDIDGTIADTKHRLHFVESDPKDWKGFFGNMHLDPVRKDVQDILIQHYNEGKTIIFLSARPDNYKDVTLKWLEDKYLTFAYTLIMRPSNDKRPDTEVKRKMLEDHFPDQSVIHSIIDDRPSVIRLWKEMGIPNVLDVGAGVEF
jgi:predicted kinase